MTQITKLDMESVRKEVQHEIAELRARGFPLSYMEDGVLFIEQLDLKTGILHKTRRSLTPDFK